MSERSEHPRLARQVGAREGAAYNYEGARVMLRRERAGVVDVPSGELLLCDPYNAGGDAVVVRLTPGSYAGYVTAFRGEYAEMHEPIAAALAIRLRDTGVVAFEPLGRHAVTPVVDDPDDPEDDGLHFVGVDRSSVYAADHAAWQSEVADLSMPPIADAMTEALTLPDSRLRVVRVTSGFGSGGYPVFGGVDARGALAAVYVSFDLVFEGERPQEPWLGEDVDVEGGIAIS